GGFERLAGGRHQRPHVVLEALGGVIGIFPPPDQRILGGSRGQPAPAAVKQGNPYAQGSEVYTSNDCHDLTWACSPGGPGETPGWLDAAPIPRWPLLPPAHWVPGGSLCS